MTGINDMHVFEMLKSFVQSMGRWFWCMMGIWLKGTVQYVVTENPFIDSFRDISSHQRNLLKVKYPKSS